MKNFKTPLIIIGDNIYLLSIVPKLVELGYNHDKEWKDGYTLVTNRGGKNGEVGLVITTEEYHNSRRTKLDEEQSKNIDLILALAAMVDDELPHVGEYVINEGKSSTISKGIHKITYVSNEYGTNMSVDDYRPGDPTQTDLGHVRKATKEEIIEHFRNSASSIPPAEHVREFSIFN